MEQSRRHFYRAANAIFGTIGIATEEVILHLLCTKCMPILLYTVFQKKTSTHIIGHKLRNSCLILIIFDTKIPHIIWHRMTA